MQTEPLKQLIYTSNAQIDPEAIVTAEFTARTQEKNRQNGITGTLAWRGQKFMQIVEGPASSVNRVFALILRDPRHSSITLVAERIVHEREFPNWDMTPFSLEGKSLPASFVPDDSRRRGTRILDAFRRGLWQ